MEKRLKEKIAENEQLVEQLRVAQDAVSAASHAKDELQKRVSTTTKQSKEAKKNTADDVMALEEVCLSVAASAPLFKIFVTGPCHNILT